MPMLSDVIDTLRLLRFWTPPDYIEVLVVVLMALFITTKGFYHARIYILDVMDLPPPAPAWLLKYSEQHIVSIVSDGLFYAWALAMGAHVFTVMGAAVLMYATTFNGLIQMAFGNGFWASGPSSWWVLGIQVPRFWRARRTKAVVAAALCVVGFLL